MTAAEPREIRLSEIPTELRNLRAEVERWRIAHAKAVTHAGELERQIKPLIAARDAARRTCDDLTEHCDSQGRRIASLDSEIIAYKEEIDQIAREKAASYQNGIAVGRKMGEERFNSAIGDLREMLVEVLASDVVGMDCDTCGGSGKVRDEVNCFSDRIGHYTRAGGEYDCEDCFGGRVSK